MHVNAARLQAEFCLVIRLIAQKYKTALCESYIFVCVSAFMCGAVYLSRSNVLIERSLLCPRR